MEGVDSAGARAPARHSSDASSSRASSDDFVLVEAHRASDNDEAGSNDGEPVLVALTSEECDSDEATAVIIQAAEEAPAGAPHRMQALILEAMADIAAMTPAGPASEAALAQPAAAAAAEVCAATAAAPTAALAPGGPAEGDGGEPVEATGVPMAAEEDKTTGAAAVEEAEVAGGTGCEPQAAAGEALPNAAPTNPRGAAPAAAAAAAAAAGPAPAGRRGTRPLLACAIYAAAVMVGLLGGGGGGGGGGGRLAPPPPAVPGPYAPSGAAQQGAAGWLVNPLLACPRSWACRVVTQGNSTNETGASAAGHPPLPVGAGGSSRAGAHRLRAAAHRHRQRQRQEQQQAPAANVSAAHCGLPVLELPWGNLTSGIEQKCRSAIAAATAAVQRIVRPTRPVPPLYRPSPPCLAVQRGRGAPAPGEARSAEGAGALRRLVQHAASALALPMLPPLAWPLASPAAAPGGNRSASASQERQQAAPGGGLTLPMLPPAKEQSSGAPGGGLTLPMLPPVACHQCGTQLQQLPCESSRRLAPVHEPPTCPSAPSSASGGQQPAPRAAQQHQQPQQGGGGGSSSGFLLVPMLPPLISGAQSAQGIQQVLGLNGEQHGSQRRRAARPAEVAGVGAAGSAAELNSSAAEHGGWVSTWVSLPMLVPADGAAERPPLRAQRRRQEAPGHSQVRPGPSQQQQPASRPTRRGAAPKQGAGRGAAGGVAPWAAKVMYWARNVEDLIVAARSRSLQCVVPQETPAVFGPDGRTPLLPQHTAAFAANHEAADAAARLVGAVQRLQAAAAAAGGAAELYASCGAVGGAHLALQARMGPALFRQSLLQHSKGGRRKKHTLATYTAGWDRKTARAAVKWAAQLSKAASGLHHACQQLSSWQGSGSGSR